MKHVKRSVLLWYSPQEMYALVTRVEDYPKFLPWCERAEVVEAHADGVTARLHLAYAGVRHAFTTRNLHSTDRAVTMGLVDGPFSVLDGTWHFVPLAAPGSQTEDACRIALRLQARRARGARRPGVRPRRRHLRRLVRAARRAGLWRALRRRRCG
jgi:ribosome-associated toxin RatA of RatAB toxin-antitoxin module